MLPQRSQTRYYWKKTHGVKLDQTFIVGSAHNYFMQQKTKIKKRHEKKTNEELQALNAMRDNQDLHDAVTIHITREYLSGPQRDRLRAVLAVLSHGPINKLLAFL